MLEAGLILLDLMCSGYNRSWAYCSTILLACPFAPAQRHTPHFGVRLRVKEVVVGCPIAPFETLADVAVIYGLDLECFMNELRQTIRIKEDAHSYSV